MKILKFYSNTCGPCKVLERNLKEAGIEYEDIDVMDPGIIDELDDVDLLEYYHIKAVPTLVIIDSQGNEIKRNVGILPVDKLKEFCNETN